jgi:addiction module HigA family antidote
MKQFNPPHPGEFILATYIKPFGLSCRFLANKLDVAPSTLNRILMQKSGVSPEMALRLSKAFESSPESWLNMQQNWDLWQARKRVKLMRVKKIKLVAA